MNSLLPGAELTTSQFASISQLVKELCGINLHQGKMMLVKARLSKRLRQLGLTSFGQYMDRIRDDANGGEVRAMLEALSTNLTYFFREEHHFQVLRRTAIPAMLARHKRDRRVRLWSAGCSSGEEAYSIAMTLHEVMGGCPGWDVGILGTDLSTQVLRMAMEALYTPDRLRQMGPSAILEHFTAHDCGGVRRYRLKEPLRRLVTFARLNLMDAWPMTGTFDVIFCRNVMIYFDKATQQRLIQRFWNQLCDGGLLFIGHSESLAGIEHRFGYVEPTVYQKR
ncbi:MAG: protein-glutamate O-methyltransferase CheR [Planctomycetaceae bacterium]|nr:protein-glutamate O-methyltransferase CheR [Planctomycetaceae bacterium]